MELKKYLAEKRQLVEEYLEHYMLRAQGPFSRHIEAMRYSLFAGGKRVRPILCLAAAEAVDSTCHIPMQIPCALEIIHTYSLIHDDLPAMDNDDLRRGMPTNHKVFGEAEAILAGDGLLTFAFELLSSPELRASLASHDNLRLLNIIAQASGSCGMVGGQSLDLASEGQRIDFETLRQIHAGKTGALIAASIQAGAIMGKATASQFEDLSSYGNRIGLLFQIVDDLLNVVGDQVTLGKAAGSDARKQKATYPALFGLDETRTKAKKAAAEAIASLTQFGPAAEPLRELARYILSRDH